MLINTISLRPMTFIKKQFKLHQTILKEDKRCVLTRFFCMCKLAFRKGEPNSRKLLIHSKMRIIVLILIKDILTKCKGYAKEI